MFPGDAERRDAEPDAADPMHLTPATGSSRGCPARQASHRSRPALNAIQQSSLIWLPPVFASRIVRLYSEHTALALTQQVGDKDRFQPAYRTSMPFSQLKL